MLTMWEEMTDTKNPYEWCKKYMTPILAMVSLVEQQNAKRLFHVINDNNADKKDVGFALDYLSKKPDFVLELNDQAKIEAAFTGRIVGRYAVMLRDNGKIRKHLMDFVPEDIYQWYGSPSVQSEIQKLARKSYLNGENSAVMEQIDMMSADEAKELLKKLVTEDVEVGISIISKEGE